MALLLVAMLALVPRALVPIGYMPSAGGVLELSLCSGQGPATVTVDVGGGKHHGDGGAAAHMPCAFAAGLAPMLGAAPPVLLAGAIAYILAKGADPAPAPLLRSLPWLRPPLRGPPAV